MAGGLGAKGAAFAMVKQVEETAGFCGAVDNQLIVDLNHVDILGLVKQGGKVDGNLNLVVIDAALELQRPLFQQVRRWFGTNETTVGGDAVG